MPISSCLAVFTALLALASPATAGWCPADPAPGPQDAEGGSGEALQRLVIGKSLSGIDLEAQVLAQGDMPLEQRRGLLVVSGLDGRRMQLDEQVLRRTIARIAQREDLAKVLGDDMLVFVSRANPSGSEGQSMGDAMVPPATEGNRRSLDKDRDGRRNEDHPSDLDGDMQISWMRVLDGAGEWVIDEHDPRAMRKARTDRGERGTHRLIREGLDDDADGAWHEDDGSGVRLNANFPHGWDEYPADTGAYPLSEPETRALVDFLLAHPGILGVVVIGEEDTLVSLPSVAKKVDRGGFFGGFRSPLDGLLEEDVASLKELKRRIEELSEEPHDVKGDGPRDGGLLAWAYHQGGRWPLGLSPWSVPDELAKPEDAVQDGEAAGDEEKVDTLADVMAAASGPDDVLGFDEDGGAYLLDSAGDVSEEEPAPSTLDESRIDAAVAQVKQGGAGMGSTGKANAGGKRGGKQGGKRDGKQDGNPDDEADGPASDKESPVPAAILQWLDTHQGGEGFVAWTEYEHPELGEVEIGGLTDTAALTAGRLPEEMNAFADQLADLLVATLGWFPEVALEDVEITSHGDGLYALEVTVVNTGVLPTSTKVGADARITRPIRVRLQLPEGVERLTGPQQELVRRLDGGGGRETLRWMVAGAGTGTQLVLVLDADTVSDQTLQVVLP